MTTIRTTNRRKGQTMIILAVSATLILSLLGMVLDGGRIYYEKRRVQAAADSGVLAAVQELRRGNDDLVNEVDPAAVFDTALNGYDRNNSTITVDVPPTSGSAAGDPNAAEVTITRVVPTTFMRVAGRNASTVVARSVAGLRPTNDFCIYALNPTRSGAFTNNGGAAFNSTCGIMVNSDASDAFEGVGSGACTYASYIGVTGDYNTDCPGTTPDTGVPPEVDPLANLDEPSPVGLPNGRFTGPPQNRTYYPGYYANRITIGNGNVHFMPGMYYLENGINFTGGTITGTDVFFFNNNTTGNDPVRISGGATVNFSAPTSGPYKGVLFFSTRSAPYVNPANNVARGSSSSTFNGALYFPTEHIDWAGNPAGTTEWTLVIAQTVNISGGASQSVINPPSESESPLTAPRFLE